MKTLKILPGIAVAVSLFFVISCDPTITTGCVVSTFFWEDQLYHASYSSSGRLTLLESDSSKINFYYDESDKLYKAEVINTGDLSPRYRWEFTHGPFGISEIDFYYLLGGANEHSKEIIHYASPTLVDYVTTQEFYMGAVSFEMKHTITYSGGNVSYVDNTSSVIHTAYRAGKYDNKKNPFKLLAAATGNPLFFPACRFVFFPVSVYDIPYVSIFSTNNPVSGSYQIIGAGLDPQVQKFKYDYAGAYPIKILWTDTSYGLTESEDYAFKLDCSSETP